MTRTPATLTSLALVWSAILFSLVLVACGASPRRSGWFDPGFSGPQPVGGGAVGGAGGGPAALSADPREALNQLDQHMRSNGYQPLGSAVHNPSLPQDAPIAYAIDAQATHCHTAVALGSPGSNLTMMVIDEQGRTVGANVETDARPWVTVCGVAGRLTVRLQNVQGDGNYYYIAYQGPTSRRVDLAALFGGAATTNAQRAELDSETAARLTQLDQQLSRENFQRLSQQAYGEHYRERQPRQFDLNLQQGWCYTFATFGGPGTTDTDVFLTDPGGEELESDTRAERDARVRFCPQQSGPYVLRTLLYHGNGPVFTVGYAQAQGGAATAQSGDVMGSQATTAAGIEQNFRLLDADMRARGYESYGEPSRGTLQPSQSRDYPLELEGGKCYAILAVGDNGVRNLDLVVTDQAGREIDQDVETDARPVVRVCAGRTGNYSIRVRMSEGAGNFVYAPYRWPRGTRGPFGLEGLIYVRLAEVTSLLAVEGYEPDIDAAPGRGRLARQTQSRTHALELSAGQCYSVLVVGGEGVHDLDASLLRGSDSVVSDQTRTAFPSVRHCAEQAGRYSLQVTATGGAGEYFYQIFRRSGP